MNFRGLFSPSALAPQVLKCGYKLHGRVIRAAQVSQPIRLILASPFDCACFCCFFFLHVKLQSFRRSVPLSHGMPTLPKKRTVHLGASTTPTPKRDEDSLALFLFFRQVCQPCSESLFLCGRGTMVAVVCLLGDRPRNVQDAWNASCSLHYTSGIQFNHSGPDRRRIASDKCWRSRPTGFNRGCCPLSCAAGLTEAELCFGACTSSVVVEKFSEE